MCAHWSLNSFGLQRYSNPGMQKPKTRHRATEDKWWKRNLYPHIDTHDEHLLYQFTKTSFVLMLVKSWISLPQKKRKEFRLLSIFFFIRIYIHTCIHTNIYRQGHTYRQTNVVLDLCLLRGTQSCVLKMRNILKSSSTITSKLNKKYSDLALS